MRITLQLQYRISSKVFFMLVMCSMLFAKLCSAQSILPMSVKESIDSITSDTTKIDFMLNEIWSYVRKDPDVSFVLLDMVDSMLVQSDIAYKKDVAIYYRGILHKNVGQYEESEKYLTQYKELAFDDIKKLASVKMALSNLYREQSLWAQSMQMAKESREHFIEFSDTVEIISASSTIGYSLVKLGRIEDGMRYHREALSIADKKDLVLQKSIALSNIGLAYERKNNLDSANYYHHAAEKINLENEDAWGLAEDYINLSRVALQQNKASEALSFAKLGLANSNKVKDPRLIAICKINIGRANIAQKKYNLGIYQITKVLDNENLSKAPAEKISAHYRLYEAYKAIQNPSLSLIHFEAYQKLNDQYNGLEMQNEVNGIELLYKSEQKEKEISLLNLQNESTAERLQHTRRQFVSLGIFSAVIASLLIGLFMLFRKTKAQQSQLSKTLAEKNILLKEIHHRVKNNLQVISSLLNLQSKYVKEGLAKEALKDGQNRVKSMGLIHQRLYQNENLTSIDVREYLEKLITSLFKSYKYSKDQIYLEMHIEDIQLDVDTLIPLGLIVNELISNSLKHAFELRDDGSITVSLTEKNEILILEVKDNGKGMEIVDSSMLKKTFGYKLINAFSTQLDAKISIDGSDGTSVRLLINDYKKVA